MTQSVLGMGGGNQRWRAEPRPKATGRHARQARIRLFKKLGATFAALAVIGVGLALEFRVWGTTPVITYYAVDYEAPLPPNAWAYEDCNALQDAGARSFLNPQAMASPPTAALNTKPTVIHDAWLTSLREAVATAAKRDSHGLVVIYLSMHGVVNDSEAGKPQPCLLLPDATRKGAAWADTTYWLPLAKVLDAMEAAAVEQETHVLLALDANRIDVVSELGILQNDFAKVARDEVLGGERQHVSVLNSTGVGQLAWSFPELGRSVFGYYFNNGLRGAADADGDKQVELKELHAYVESNVDRLVRGQLGEEVRQTPALWRSKGKEDRVVASCVPNYQPSEPTVVAVNRREAPNVLKDFQTAFANSSETGFRRARPLEWEARRRELWRLEQLQSAGQAYAQPSKDAAFAKVESAGALLNRAKAWSYDTEAAQSPLANLELSLSWTTRFSPKTLALLTNEQFASYSKQLIEIATGPTAPAAAPTPATPADTAAPAPANSGSTAAPAAPAESPAADAASAKEQRKLIEEPSVAVKTAVAWRWFCEGRRTKAEVERVLETLLPTKSTGDNTTIAELQWMRLLLRDFDEQLWDRNSALVMSLGQVRDASEQAATMLAPRDANRGAAEPLNLSAFGVLSQRLEAIERRRRDFEDQALIGDLSQTDALRETAGNLVAEYAAWRNLAAKLDDAQRFWDEAVAESPSMLAWQVRRARYGAAFLLDAEGARRLFDQLNQLANTLDRPEQLFAGASPAAADGSDLAVAFKNVEGAVHEPEKSYDALKLAYENELSEVAKIDKQVNTVDLRRAEILLAGPMPGFGNRDQLLAQRDRLAKSLFHRTADAKPAPKEQKISVEPLQALAAWAVTSAADNGSTPTTSGAAIRERLGSTPSLTSALKAAWKAGDSVEQSTAIRAIDLDSRRLAILSTYSFGEGAIPEPSAERGWLRQMMFAQWHGQRLLDDFWGDAADNLESAGDSRQVTQHYFARAAQKLVAAMEAFARRPASADVAVSPEAASALAQCSTDLANSVQQRVAAAKEGITPVVPKLTAKLIDATSGAVQFHEPTAALPPGHAAVWIPEVTGLLPDGNEDALRRNGRDVATANGKPLPFRFSWTESKTPDPSAAPAQLVATVLYRGHYWRSEEVIQPIGAPLTVSFERPEYVKPQVTVFDPRTENVAFSVILDCSGSMNENGVNRLDLAKDAIEAALAPIAKSGRHQVSLWLFGHQIIVPKPKGGDETLFARLSDYTVKRSRPIVHPNDDIERIFEMAPLTVQSLDGLSKELGKPDIRPTGSTPLYKAIARALQEDDEAVIRANRNRRTQFRRHVIVITDGNNFLYREAAGGRITDELTQQALTPEEFQPSIANLRDLFRRFGNPQLDVVGFPLKMGEVYNPDLVRLATDQTKGTFVPDAGTEELVTHLKRAIGMRSYQVFDTAGEQRSETAIFNDPAVVNPVPPVGENVLAKIVDENVDVKSDPFPLVRSEAIKLYLQAAGAGETLVHRRYVEQMDDPETTTSSGVLVTAHETDSAQLSAALDEVTFRASLQDANEVKYLPPPAEAWAEFDMPLPGGGRRTYLSYDLELVPQRSAAVLEWTILDFPLARTVETAEMRIWWRTRPSEKRKSRVIAELRQATEFPDFASGVTLQAQVDGTTLIVQEQHAEAASPANRTSNGVPWIRIDVSLPREMVKSIKREFFPDIRSARHTFVIEGGNPTSIESAEVVLHELDFERSTDQARDLNFATFPNVKLKTHSGKSN